MKGGLIFFIKFPGRYLFALEGQIDGVTMSYTSTTKLIVT
jgi:hypothetical protein